MKPSFTVEVTEIGKSWGFTSKTYGFKKFAHTCDGIEIIERDDFPLFFMQVGDNDFEARQGDTLLASGKLI